MKKVLRKIKWKLLYPIKGAFYLFNKSWNDFYGWMLDYQDRSTTLEQILRIQGPTNRYKGLWHWQKGEDYLKYIVKHGTRPTHRIFDIGCGYGRCTIPFLRFQKKGGHYIGSEISKHRLSLAKEWIKKERLDGKSYNLIFSKDTSLSFLNDNEIDIVWSLSVFNHMPDDVLETTFGALQKKVVKGGFVFAFFVDVSAGPADSVKFFPRSEAFMLGIAKKYGFNPTISDDWESEYAEDKKSLGSRMMIAIKI